ncbi:MAG: hypothetical protein N2588_02295 [Rhodovarius sp.]|nr:hypothetical protein [Rhodovarius sp.]
MPGLCMVCLLWVVGVLCVVWVVVRAGLVVAWYLVWWCDAWLVLLCGCVGCAGLLAA